MKRPAIVLVAVALASSVLSALSGCAVTGPDAPEPSPFRRGLWPIWTADARPWAGVSETRAAGPFLHWALDTGSAGNSVNLTGGATMSLTGALYFQDASVTYNGGASITSTCTQIISDTVALSGNATFTNTCPNGNTSPISLFDSLGLVE